MTPALHINAINPDLLDSVRRSGTDGHGNQWRTLAAAGEGEPLRCCLRYAESGERIALISYAPFDHPSVWTEVGPVYVHAHQCNGYTTPNCLPAELARGPRVLRTYRADDTMDYEHIAVVVDDVALEPMITRLIEHDSVATVHVRTLGPQCFLYAVTSASTD